MFFPWGGFLSHLFGGGPTAPCTPGSGSSEMGKSHPGELSWVCRGEVSVKSLSWHLRPICQPLRTRVPRVHFCLSGSLPGTLPGVSQYRCSDMPGGLPQGPPVHVCPWNQDPSSPRTVWVSQRGCSDPPEFKAVGWKTWVAPRRLLLLENHAVSPTAGCTSGVSSSHLA